MINQSTKYTIQIADIAAIYEHELMEHCLVIFNDSTGEYLTGEEYDEWIRYIGGQPK